MILATGFTAEPGTKAAKSKVKPAVEQAPARASVDEPPARQQQAQAAAVGDETPQQPADDDEDLDIPAFLRRYKK